MDKILYGKDVNESIENELNDKIKLLNAKGVKPKIAIVRVGENPGDIFTKKQHVKKQISLA